MLRQEIKVQKIRRDRHLHCCNTPNSESPLSLGRRSDRLNQMHSSRTPNATALLSTPSDMNSPWLSSGHREPPDLSRGYVKSAPNTLHLSSNAVHKQAMSPSATCGAEHRLFTQRPPQPTAINLVGSIFTVTLPVHGGAALYALLLRTAVEASWEAHRVSNGSTSSPDVQDQMTRLGQQHLIASTLHSSAVHLGNITSYVRQHCPDGGHGMYQTMSDWLQVCRQTERHWSVAMINAEQRVQTRRAQRRKKGHIASRSAVHGRILSKTRSQQARSSQSDRSLLVSRHRLGEDLCAIKDVVNFM